ASEGGVLGLEDRAHSALPEDAPNEVFAADGAADEATRESPARRRRSGDDRTSGERARQSSASLGRSASLAADGLPRRRTEDLLPIVGYAAMAASDKPLAH